MTIQTHTKITVGPVTVERSFTWDALSSLARFSPLALLAGALREAGAAVRVEQERAEGEKR